MSGKAKRRHEPDTSHEIKSIPAAKTRTWTTPTILGIVLAVVGIVVGAIALRPQIAVLPQEPLDASQPFSVPFRIENTGNSSWWLQRIFCYYHKVQVDGINVQKGTSHSGGWNHHMIERSEAETIRCNLAQAPLMPATADIAIVVDYRPWQKFPWIFRRIFRFKGEYVNNWQWLAQPSEEIQKDASSAVDDHMKRFPESR
jgi:hypothetical protein